MAGAESARHRCLPRELRRGLERAHCREHRLRSAREHVVAPRHHLGDVGRLEHDLRVRHERSRLGVPRAAEAEQRARSAEPLGEIGKRRDAHAAADEQRDLDPVEAVPERAEHRDPVAWSRGAKRTRPGADRVDQEAELSLRGERQRHRPGQEPPRRLEHEELPRDAGLDRAALEPQQRVRADRLDREDVKRSALQPRSAPEARGRPRCARSRSRGRPRPHRTGS